MVVRRIAELLVNVEARRAEQQVDSLEQSVESLVRTAATGINIAPTVDDSNVEAFTAGLERRRAELTVEAVNDRQETDRTVARIEAQIGEIEANVDLDPSEAEAEAQRLRASIRDIQIQAELDDSRIRNQIDNIDSELRSVRDVDVNVNADVSNVAPAIEGVRPDPVMVPVEIDEASITGGISNAIGSSTAIAATGFAAVGVAGAAALVTGFNGALEFEASNDRLAATLGLTPEESALLGAAAAETYAGAWGESIDEVNQALRGIAETGLLDVETASQEAFESSAQAALDLADVLDTDVNEVTRAASQLFRNGLADSAEEAFDLIAAATQEGGNATGELLEVITEYSINWQEAGFSGEQAMGQIVQAVDSGTFQLDRLGDLIKESGVQLAELDETSLMTVAEATGLAASEIQNLSDAAKEGDSISFLRLVESVQDIEDASERSRAAVELFGTPFEDLSNSAFLDIDFGAELDGIAGSANALGDQLNDNLSTRLESLRRQGFLALTEAAEQFLLPAIDALIPVFDNLQQSIQPAIDAVIGGIEAFDAAIFATLNGDFETRDDGFAGFMANLANTIIVDVIPAIQQFNTVLTEQIFPVVAELARLFFEDALPVLTEFARTFIEDLAPILSSLGTIFIEQIVPAVSEFVTILIADVLPVVVEIAGSLQSFAVDIIENIVVPLVETLSRVFEDDLVPIFERDVVPAIEEVQAALKAMEPRVRIVAEVIELVVIPAIEVFLKTVISVFGSIISIVTGFVSTVRSLLTGDLGGVVSGVGKIFDGLISLVTGPLNAIQDVVETQVGDISDLFQSGFDAITDVVEDLLSPIQSLIDLIGDIPTSLPNPFASFSVPDIQLPNVPGFAFGGITRAPTFITSEYGHEEAIFPTNASVDYIKSILSQSSNDVLGRLYADYERNVQTATTTNYGNTTNHVQVNVQDNGRKSRGERVLAANLTASAVARRLQPVGV